MSGVGKARLDGWSFQILAALMEAQQDGAPILDKPTVGEIRRKLISHTPTKPESFVAQSLVRLIDCDLAFRVLGSATDTFTVTSKGEAIAKGLLLKDTAWTMEFRDGDYIRDVVLVALKTPIADHWMTVPELMETTGISESCIRRECKKLEWEGKIERSQAHKGVSGRLIDQFQLPRPAVTPTGTFQMASDPVATVTVTVDTAAWHADPAVDDAVKAAVQAINSVPDPVVARETWTCPETGDVLEWNGDGEPDPGEPDPTPDPDEDPYVMPPNTTTVILHMPDELLEKLGAIAVLLGCTGEEVLLKLAENLVFQTHASIASDLTPEDSSRF